MRRLALGLGLLLALAGAARAEEPAHLSLRAAIALARRCSPTLRAAQLGVTLAERGRDAAGADRGPSLGLSSLMAGAGQGTQPGPNAWDTKVTLSQSVFDAFRVEDARAQAQLVWDRAQVIGTGEDLSLQYMVGQGYVAVLCAQALEAASRIDLEQARAQEQLATTRLRGSVGTQLEVLQAQSLVAGAEDRLVQASANLAAVRFALQANLGQPDETAILDPDTTLLPVAEVASPSAAIAGRPDLRALELTRQVAELAVTQRTRAKLPTLDAAANVTATPFAAASYGVKGTLTWPLFDAGRLEVAIAQARLETDRAAAVLEAGRKSADLELRTTQEALRAVRQRLPLTGRQEASAMQALHLARLRYERGVGTSLEVLQALTTLNDARRAAITAKFDELATRLNVARAAALPLETLLAP